jgi:hypothetical protein
MING